MLVGLLALWLAGTVAADDYAAVRERAAGLVGEDAEIAVAESPMDGMLQVRIGSDIVYMSDDGRFLMQGRLWDLDTREDLTDTARSEIRREVLQTLDHDQLISFGPDDAEHEIVVFTDVDCGYCRRLHEQIAEYNEAGIQVSYAAFPRAGVGSQTFHKMVSVWCAADQHEAMTIAKAGETPDPANCDSPVAEQYRLGQALGVTGTPALMTASGELIPGYVPPGDLRIRLDRGTQRASAE
ncbi:MAG: DsbC family protein [Wenzhouxiangellaceae bacterium]|nr:DsbC family protein [Wenzhouxiangellaceae bacterium]